MSYALIVSLAAAAVQLTAYILYNREIFAKQNTPNLTSWLIWGGVTVLNSSSYLSLSHNFILSFPALATSAAVVTTMIIVIATGTFGKIHPADIGAGLLALAAAVVWKLTSSPIVANIMIQGANVLGVIPTVLSVHREPARERPLPWILWSIAYTLAMIVALMQSPRFATLLYPFVGITTSLSVAILAHRSVN